MKIDLKWTGNMSFEGVSVRTGNVVAFDASPAVGGEDAGVSPMEVVLMGLAGCSGMDVVSILSKKRVEFDLLEVAVEGERADEHPKVFTKVEMVFTFSGQDLKLKSLEDAVRLSIDKYCSVAGMIDKTAEISWRIEIK